MFSRKRNSTTRPVRTMMRVVANRAAVARSRPLQREARSGIRSRGGGHMDDRQALVRVARWCGAVGVFWWVAF